MALVVSDNSPLNLLIQLRLADLIPSMFGQLIIPSEVATEMMAPSTPADVRKFIGSPPCWLSIQDPNILLTISRLDAGELAAISLAIELQATLFIDELRGRQEARSRGVSVLGLIGILEQAANRGLVNDLAAVHARIRPLGFHISDKILDASLARHLSYRTAKPP